MLLTPQQIKHVIEILPKREEIIPGYTPAAVLVLFLNQNHQTHIVYIRRTKGLNIHSGQMAFPGGKINAADVSSYAAAVRETHEEIGVSENRYRYLGDLGYFHTLTSRYDAAVHVAWSPQLLEYNMNQREVAAVVEIPVRTLFDQFRPDLDIKNQQELMYLNFRYLPPDSSEELTLWGLTARITHHFLQGISLTLACESPRLPTR
jgi:8-oxo-dGTP pyrophosphatase MutT (NUDIX family)